MGSRMSINMMENNWKLNNKSFFSYQSVFLLKFQVEFIDYQILDILVFEGLENSSRY